MTNKDDKLLFPGDVVGVIMEGEDDQMGILFAHLISIYADKPGWWAVSFRAIPSGDEWFWLLDDEQIRQADFTMGGKKRQLILFSRIDHDPVEEEKRDIHNNHSLTEEDSLF